MTPDNKPNLRILLIASDRFPPFRADIAVLFGKQIVGRGHTVDCLLQSDLPAWNAYETVWHGCKVHVGPSGLRSSFWDRGTSHLKGLLHDFKIFKILRSKSYDFIIIRDKFFTALPAIVASRVFTANFVYWLSYPFPEEWLFQVKKRMARRPAFYWIKARFAQFLLYFILLRMSLHTFVQTEQMKVNVKRYGIPEHKMTPVPMAVSIEDIPYFGYPLTGSKPPNLYNIAYLGTLRRMRRMDFLLRCLKLLLSEMIGVRLYFIGGSDDPKDEQFLRNEASRLGVDRFTIFTGFLPQEKAWEQLKLAHVCVSPIFPSPILDCGSPTKLLEYMAMGKVVVANDHPEQKQIILESRAGVCVPYRELDFADAILYLLKHPDLAKEMGSRGRKYITEKRNYSYMASRVENKFFELKNSR